MNGSLIDAISRRRFVERIAIGATCVATGVRAVVFPLGAYAIVPSRAAMRTSAEQWLPARPSADSMRRLAAIAMDAARAAGAEFADIRLGVERGLAFIGEIPFLDLNVGYGVRAMIDGTWSFERGSDFSIDGVAGVARRATLGAKQYAELNRQLAGQARGSAARRTLPAWADTPVVTGEWHAPVAIDPFAVPLNEHYRALPTLTDAIAPGTRNAHIANGYTWVSMTRVFASSAGSLITQTRTFGVAGWGGGASLPGLAETGVEIDAPEMTPAMLGGFELMHDLQRVYRATVYAADAWEYDKLPLRPFSDVGRFAVVFDGYSTGNIVAMAVNPALDGDRLFGLERDTSGTSFLAPAEDTLSATTPLFSPLFSMHADRRAPSPIAAQWDDEGVPIQPYSLIDSGRVVGYHTTRATAPYLSAWAAQHGQPVQSRGSCAVQHAEDLPAGGFSHTFVSHSTARASVRDLMREVKHGFYVLRGGTDVSPGLAGGRFHSAHLMLEIRNGIPVARTTFRAHLEHKTLFGKQLVSLGDASTVRMRWEGVQKGMPWRNIDSMVNAPAMLCKDVEIVGELATP